MSAEHIRGIADAVLYEGYVLYPYRPTSIKNRQRWTFGGIFPRAFAGRQGDAAAMQTQVLLQADADAAVSVHVRFLQVLQREVGRLAKPMAMLPEVGEPPLTLVPHLTVGDREFLAWEEAREREIVLADLRIDRLLGAARQEPFRFERDRQLEPLRDSSGQIVAALIRRGCTLEGFIEVAAERLASRLVRLTVRIENVTPLSGRQLTERQEAQRCAFASTHTIMTVRAGKFLSLLDPPGELREAAARCDNQGAWPVLVGKPGAGDAVLSSPIILYDYPQLAPESPGDLFDATEIDEILTLRILAMTDAEKREMAAADPRGRALLERTEALTADDLVRLHGTLRTCGSPPSGSRDLAVGGQVRLRPKARGGDIMDLALEGQIAVVEAIERDFEDRIHVAVTLLDDPGRDLGAAGFPGHRFYFSQDEVELLGVREVPG